MTAVFHYTIDMILRRHAWSNINGMCSVYHALVWKLHMKKLLSMMLCFVPGLPDCISQYTKLESYIHIPDCTYIYTSHMAISLLFPSSTMVTYWLGTGLPQSMVSMTPLTTFPSCLPQSWLCSAKSLLVSCVPPYTATSEISSGK